MLPDPPPPPARIPAPIITNGRIPIEQEPSSTTLKGSDLSSSLYLASKLSTEISSPFNFGRLVSFQTILLGLMISASSTLKI